MLCFKLVSKQEVEVEKKPLNCLNSVGFVSLSAIQFYVCSVHTFASTTREKEKEKKTIFGSNRLVDRAGRGVCVSFFLLAFVRNVK